MANVKLPGNGTAALLPDLNPRTSARSAADLEVREAIAHAIAKYQMSSSEIIAMIAGINSSYAVAVLRLHDAEGSR